ncbi:type II toxin-antitoxin system HicB family antitoxin [Novosphingobium sp. 9]|uniref:type II toxin-antitoxin system HicB family antitoxin n=1 Tax=Novosphingobium sp. 9 TaxID=2025349 RepID=UPI0021B53B4A|nr:type II toxin-antitoxin system HicB family antitoxin [Novosphingobium sp. 9]
MNIPPRKRFDHTCTVIIRWSEEDQVWLAECPELWPCITHGSTIIEAVKMLDEMIDGLEDL